MASFERIFFTEIVYLEAAKNYVRIITGDRRCLVHIPLKQIEQELPSSLFCRTHRSYIVSIEKITAFDHQFVWLGKTQIHLGVGFAEQLKLNLNIVKCDKSSKVHSFEIETRIRV